MNKNNKMPFAIIYDFDKTLSTKNMQEYDFFDRLNCKTKDFWGEVKKIKKEHSADEVLTYMKLMIDKSKEAKKGFQKKYFKKYGENIMFFEGVESWFSRINTYAKNKNVNLVHYIISSGLKEMIEGSSIANEFEKIYASNFWYDENSVACWPAQAINFTTKTQFLFRINKGINSISDNDGINKFVEKSKRPMPFENMIFIGDGDTDIPCMRLVKEMGGYSIAVYKKGKKGAKKHAEKMLEDGRININVEANYNEDKKLDKAVKLMIDEVVAKESIKRLK